MINIGSYILIIIIIINGVCVVVFCKKGYKEIDDKIKYFKKTNLKKIKKY